MSATLSMLDALADNGGRLYVLEGSSPFPPAVMEAGIRGGLIRVDPVGGPDPLDAVVLTAAGWRASGRSRPSLAERLFAVARKLLSPPLPSASLVMDIGMHDGSDTAYYLSLGHRVIAVEANPVLADEARRRFATEIQAGLLAIENIGIHNHRGTMPFYLNKFAQWSSFVPHLGQRGGDYSVVDVACAPITDVIAKHGRPFFMKVDIEGMDLTVVRQLNWRTRPQLISVEDGGFDSMEALMRLGARHFKFSNQLEVSKAIGESSSGPFGDDLPGPWLTMQDAASFYRANIRPADGMEPLNGAWWDIHAKLG